MLKLYEARCLQMSIYLMKYTYKHESIWAFIRSYIHHEDHIDHTLEYLLYTRVLRH